MKELFIYTFILTAPATSLAGNEGDAYRAVAEASYKQSGLENEINKVIELQLRHVPKEIQKVASNSYLVGKMIVERKASYTWTF